LEGGGKKISGKTEGKGKSKLKRRNRPQSSQKNNNERKKELSRVAWGGVKSLEKGG